MLPNIYVYLAGLICAGVVWAFWSKDVPWLFQYRVALEYVIGVANAYLIGITLRCASASGIGGSNKHRVSKLLQVITIPTRLGALFQLAFLSVILVVGFAGLFLDSDYAVALCDASHTPTRQAKTNHAPHDAKPIQQHQILKDVAVQDRKVGALYFSFVTLTTLGYGDFTPHTVEARKLVIWEMISAMQMLLFAIPIVIGRLTTWSNASWRKIEAFDENELKNNDSGDEIKILLGAIFVNETPAIIKEMTWKEGKYHVETTILVQISPENKERDKIIPANYQQMIVSEIFRPTHFAVVKRQK